MDGLGSGRSIAQRPRIATVARPLARSVTRIETLYPPKYGGGRLSPSGSKNGHIEHTNRPSALHSLREHKLRAFSIECGHTRLVAIPIRASISVRLLSQTFLQPQSTRADWPSMARGAPALISVTTLSETRN